MPAELVGTAYVRIRAITAGLAKDISDGVDKGVKDAGPDVTKSGEGVGDDLGKGAAKSFKGSIGDGVTEALDAPEVHRAAKDGGGSVARDVSDGVERENKRRNPFRSLLDAFKGLSFKGVDLPSADFEKAGERAADSFGDGVDTGRKRRNPFHWLLDGFKAIIPGLHRDASDAGEETGGKFADGAEKGAKDKNLGGKLGKLLGDIQLPKPIQWAGIFGPTTLAPIIGTIVSLLGLVVEALGFIVTAAAGAGVALAGIAAVAAPGFAVLLLAFKTQTKQLEKFKEAAKKLLAPWQQIGVATQRTLLPGLEDALRILGTRGGLVSLFTEFGGRIGKSASAFAVFAAHILTSEKNTRALGKILEASGTFFDNMRTAALNFIDLLMPFLATVVPLAVQFSQSLADWATHFADFINLKASTGELTLTFQIWYDRFTLLVGILGNVFAGLWGILQLASSSPAAGGLFDAIARGAKAFADWVKSAEGQNKIKKFFDDIQPVLDEVWRLLGNVFRLIIAPAVSGDGGAQMFTNLATALDFLNRVLENPITAQVVPYLLGLVVALGLLSKVPTPILSGIGSALWWVTDHTLIAGLKELGSVVWWLAKKVFLAFIDVLWDLSVALLTTPAGWVLLAVAAAAVAVYLAFRNWDTIIGWLKQAWEWFDKLSLPLKIVVGAFAALALLANPVAQFAAAVLLITAALKNWDKIVEFIFQAKVALVDFFTKTLPGFAAAVPGALGAAFDAVVSFFQGLPQRIKDAMLTGLENLPKLILDALAGLFSLGQDLLTLIADGIQAALPRLIEFFVKLPVTILGLIGKALPKMLEIGGQILEFLAEGFVKYGPKVLFFFLRLPFEILTLLRKGLVELIKLGGEMIIALFTGLWDQKDRIFDFFHDLPLNIIKAIGAAIKWLFDTGVAIIQGIIDGVASNIGNVFQFFIDLPGKIIRFLQAAIPLLFDLGVQLLQGILTGIGSLFGSFSEFFFGLPQKIVDFVTAGFGLLLDLGSSLPGKILEGVTAAAVALWDWFTALPQTILDTLTGIADSVIAIGGQILGWIGEGIVGVAQTLWDWFIGLPQTIWDTVSGVAQKIIDLGGQFITWLLQGIYALEVTMWNWFASLPQTIWDTVSAVAQKIIDLGGQFITWLLDGVNSIEQTLWDFFTGLPQKIWDFVWEGSQKLIDLGKQFITWLLQGIHEIETDLWDFFTGLPQKIWDTVKAVSSKLLDLGKQLIQWIIDGIKAAPATIVGAITDLIPGPLKGVVGGIVGIFGGEMGGIIPPTRYGTPLVAGENNRAEALIPMTRPSRALSVMQQAGLDKLVLNANGGAAATGKTVTGDTTMLHIDTAVMTTPVDADMVVSKVTAAYNRLAS